MKAKAHIILAGEILEEVDRIVGKRKRSLFIAEAIRERLERKRFLRVLEETKGTWTDKNHPDLRNSKDVEKYVRDKRQSFAKTVTREPAP